MSNQECPACFTEVASCEPSDTEGETHCPECGFDLGDADALAELLWLI